MILSYKKNGRKYPTRLGMFILGVRSKILTLCGSPTIQGVESEGIIHIKDGERLIIRNCTFHPECGTGIIIKTR